MSFFKYFFDTEYLQRRDIEELRETQQAMQVEARGSGSASAQWYNEINGEVKELAALVRVMLRKLQDAKLLDVATLREEVMEELRPKAIDVTCMKCSTKGISTEMVKVGADWMCRPCARNP